jgi:flagellar biosynthesis protein FlhB
MSDKTEQATPRRLRKAEEGGDSGASSTAAQAVAFLVALAVLPSAVRALASWATEHLKGAIAHGADATPEVSIDVVELGGTVILLILPMALAAGLASAVAHVVQTGGSFTMKRLALQLDRLNIFEGVKKLFSGTRVFAVVRSLLSCVVVAYLAYSVIRSHLLDLARLTDNPEYMGEVIEKLAFRLARDVALFGLLLGGIDLLVSGSSWQKRQRMSKDEVKREHREEEGDPHLKQARKRAHQEMLDGATIAAVRDATFLVKNPTHVACALRYRAGEDDTPVLIASGEGDFARRLIEAAHQYGVPVVQNVPLARALNELALDSKIPAALFDAVAEVLREIADPDRAA